LRSVGDVCDRCHAIMTQYTEQPAGCHSCHSGVPSVPHPLGRQWLSSLGSRFHGSPEELDLPYCQGCHDTSTFCSKCHFGIGGARVPDGVDWSHGWMSHTQSVLVATEEVCEECHELTRSFGQGPGNITCGGCHDGTYPMHESYAPADSNLHRAPAKDNLKLCQLCHGRPGTSFESGVSVLSCSPCHQAAKAHPTDWQGSGTFSHRTAGNKDTSCALCHDYTQGRTPPLDSAPSCFSAEFTNANGQTRSCHPAGWVPHDIPFAAPSQHGSPAKENLAFCQTCHGAPGTTGFGGGTTDVACSSCHAAADAHPTDWQGAGTYSHQSAGNISVACTICHDVTDGRAAPNPDAPSCFSVSFTNANGQTRSCHAGGPGVPHTMPFSSPAQHGSPAKQDLTYCQLCHGVPGSSNFGGGSAGVACSSCHTAAKAHPTNWQGAGTYSHQTAGTLTGACELCHRTTGTGTGPLAGAPSCFSSTFTNALGQTRPCHAGGPGIPHAAPAQFAVPSVHGPVAKQNLVYCQTCHGQPGTRFFEGGDATACAACHTAAKAHPTNWQGAGAYSHRNADNMPTTCNLCHDYTMGRTPPMAGSPSCFAASFTNALGQTRACHSGGPGVPHAMPFAAPSLHGSPAKADLTYCQDCHGTTGSNFAGGTSGVACSSCHTAARAHPTNWQGAGTYSHQNAGNLSAACGLCHRTTGTGTGPLAGAPSCFSSTFTNALGQTRSCHPGGPGASHAMGAAWMNKSLSTFHGNSSLVCSNCHTFANKCSQCHFGTIANPTYGPTGSHVSEGSHDNYEAYASVCNACHNTNRTYGHSPGSCHNCH
jgi:hypothetical protein